MTAKLSPESDCRTALNRIEMAEKPSPDNSNIILPVAPLPWPEPAYNDGTHNGSDCFGDYWEILDAAGSSIAYFEKKEDAYFVWRLANGAAK